MLLQFSFDFVLIPVDRIVGIFILLCAFNKGIFVIEADAIFKKGTSNEEIKFNEGISQHEADQAIPIFLQTLSISLNSFNPTQFSL